MDSTSRKYYHHLHFFAVKHFDITGLTFVQNTQVNAKDNFGNTALLNAVYEGHTEAVKELLKLGAKKDVKGPDGKTPKEAAEKDEIRQLF